MGKLYEAVKRGNYKQALALFEEGYNPNDIAEQTDDVIALVNRFGENADRWNLTLKFVRHAYEHLDNFLKDVGRFLKPLAGNYEAAPPSPFEDSATSWETQLAMRWLAKEIAKEDTPLREGGPPRYETVGHLIVRMNDVVLTRAWLDYGGDPTIPDWRGWDARLVAAAYSNSEVFRLLFTHPVNERKLPLPSAGDFNVFHVMAASLPPSIEGIRGIKWDKGVWDAETAKKVGVILEERPEAVALLVKPTRENINEVYTKDQTPIEIALRMGKYETAFNMLNSLGEKEFEELKKNVPTLPAMIILYWRGPEQTLFGRRMLQILSEHGYDLDEGRYMGRTLAHYAVERGNPDAVEALALLGADLLARDNLGRRPADMRVSNTFLQKNNFEGDFWERIISAGAIPSSLRVVEWNGFEIRAKLNDKWVQVDKNVLKRGISALLERNPLNMARLRDEHSSPREEGFVDLVADVVTQKLHERQKNQGRSLE